MNTVAAINKDNALAFTWNVMQKKQEAAKNLMYLVRNDK